MATSDNIIVHVNVNGQWRDKFVVPRTNDKGERVVSWFHLRHGVHTKTGMPTPMNLFVDNVEYNKTTQGIVSTNVIPDDCDYIDIDIYIFVEQHEHPFHNAAKWGYLEAVTKWIASGTEVDFVDRDGMTALMHASSENKINVVAKLLSYGANIDLVDRHNESAVMWAVHTSSTECLKLLLDSGANYTTENDRNMTPLSQALYYKWYPTYSLIAKQYTKDNTITPEIEKQLEKLRQHYEQHPENHE